MKPKKTRGQRVIAFIEKYCRVPEGRHVGKPIKLLRFQKRFILSIYDNPSGTSRAYLSIARKNGKTALIACLVLVHLVGPEARQNSQIISGARSREQASLVYKLAEKMVRLSPELNKIVRVTPSTKTLIGLPMNVEYRAISAEAGTAHGLSPVLAVLDEVGQVKGPYDAFVEAIETSQGAHENPLLIAISTQAATDADLFSIWLDDAEKSKDPRVISHVYSAPEGCELSDREAWAAANPALGEFREVKDMEDAARTAERLPVKENSFRWLFLNQRVSADCPFVSLDVWKGCGAKPRPLDGMPVYGGLDLSSVNDLTALVYAGRVGKVWQVHPTFWLPESGLTERARSDRVPYDVWHREGFLEATPGKTIDYDFVAHRIWDDFQRLDIRGIAFDEWQWVRLRPYLAGVGFREEQLEGDGALFRPMRQGFKSMSPALSTLEALLLNAEIAHGNHPVLNMCAANAVSTSDPAGNRKLDKSKARGRIDGMVALTMAVAAGTAGDGVETESVYTQRGVLIL